MSMSAYHYAVLIASLRFIDIRQMAS